MIGVPTFLRVIGVLLIIAALPAAWVGLEATDTQGLENDIATTEAQSGIRFSKEKAERDIAGFRQQLEDQKFRGNMWLAAAGLGLALGVGLTLLPSSRKPRPAAPAVAPGQD